MNHSKKNVCVRACVCIAKWYTHLFIDSLIMMSTKFVTHLLYLSFFWNLYRPLNGFHVYDAHFPLCKWKKRKQEEKTNIETSLNRIRSLKVLRFLYHLCMVCFIASQSLQFHLYPLSKKRKCKYTLEKVPNFGSALDGLFRKKNVELLLWDCFRRKNNKIVWINWLQ